MMIRYPIHISYGLSISSHYYGEGRRWQAHAHPHPSLYYVAHGSGRCVINNKTFQLITNTIVVLPGGMTHEFIDRAGKSMTVFVIYFDERQIRRNQEVLERLLTQPQITPLSAQRADYVRPLLRQMLQEQRNREDGFGLALQACFSILLLELHREWLAQKDRREPEDKSSIHRVQTALSYIARKLYESHSLPSAAKMADLSVRHFSSLCREVTGRSFTQYLHGVRLGKARELLQTTAMPVSAIAFEVGYEQPSTFYRQFKKQFGTAPLQYRS